MCPKWAGSSGCHFHLEGPKATVIGKGGGQKLLGGWWPEVRTKGIPLVTGAAFWITPSECCAFKILWGRVVSHPPSFANCPSAGGWNTEFGKNLLGDQVASPALALATWAMPDAH